MISEHWAILAALLPVAGFASYIRDTLRGRTQPNRVSWAIWATAPLIAFPAELTAHAPPEIALVTLALGLGPLLVLIASTANRGAYWQLTRFDVLCGIVSVLALALWAVTRRGDVAVLFSIAADALAAAPTVRKSWSHPKSESCWTYAASGAGGGLTLLTIRHWTFSAYGFPLYVVAVCGIITVLIARPTPNLAPPALPQARLRPRGALRQLPAGLAAIAAVPALGALGVAGFEITTGIQVPGATAVVSAGLRGLPHFPGPGTPRLRPERPAPHRLSQLPLPPTRPAPSARPQPGPSRPRPPSPSPRPSPSPSPTHSPSPAPGPPHPSPAPTYPSPAPSPTQPSPSPTHSPSPAPSPTQPSPTATSPSPTSTPTYPSPTATPGASPSPAYA